MNLFTYRMTKKGALILVATIFIGNFFLHSLPRYIFFHMSDEMVKSITYIGTDRSVLLGPFHGNEIQSFTSIAGIEFYKDLKASAEATGYSGWTNAGKLKVDFGFLKYRLDLRTNGNATILYWKVKGWPFYRNDDLVKYIDW